MATVPLSGTNIHILSSVPFNNDYKHSRWFTSVSSQTSYFTSKPVVHSISEANFQRIEGKHFIAVNKSIDELWGANYLMFQNKHYNNKWFYAFVTRLEYKQRNNTHVHFEVDVLQTWKFDMDFKPSYVVREHTRLWNNDGTPVINTIDEGLSYGTEYDNRTTSRIRDQLNGGYKWLVIVTKTPIEPGSENIVEGKVVGNPQPLSYYLVPFKDNDKTPTVIMNGVDFPITPPSRVLSEIYKFEKAVNNIVSIYVTDYTGIKTTFSNDSVADVITFPNNGNAKVSSAVIAGSIYCIKVEEVHRFHVEEIEVTGDKYQYFVKGDESKLLMHPYTSLVFDDMRGNRTEYKLEHIKGKKLVVQVKGSLGVTNHVSYGIKMYNNDSAIAQEERADESALISSVPSDIPIVNDMLAAFLQGNRNSIQNQKSSVLWNGVMNGIGSTVSGLSAAKSKNPFGLAAAATEGVKGAGETVLQMQGIQAKQDDISNIPPQIAKQGSSVAYDYGNNFQGLYILRKQIKPEYRKILTDFFNMYGYKVNEVKIPNFNTRRNWNYVETLSCNILGSFNNRDLQILKDIFDGGITLWHTDDVGNYNLENGVR